MCQKIVTDIRKLHKKLGSVEVPYSSLLRDLEKMIVLICSSLDKIRETLHSESLRSETPALKDGVKSFALHAVSNFTASSTTSATTSSSLAAPASGPLFDKLIGQIISSQKNSLNNMKTCLRDKIQSLEFALK